MKPARLLRRSADNRHPRPEQTPREIAREERILAVAQTVMAENGRHEVSLTGMALALHIARNTLRHHFCDLDELLNAILFRHLVRLARVVGEAATNDDPEAHRKRRAAYLAATRTVLGGLTEAHLLLVRDRHLLPADLRPNIEGFRHDIAQMVAGPQAAKALTILDSPDWSPEDIEAALTAQQPQPAPQPHSTQPEPQPEPPEPAPPPTTLVRAPKNPPNWLQLAFEPEPPDPTNDLYRYGRGWRPKPDPKPP